MQQLSDDPCIPAEWASDEILKENAVICEIAPADWQLDEIMKIRLGFYLNTMWCHLEDEWGHERSMEDYRDGLVNGFAEAVRQVACKFDIKLGRTNER